MYHFFVGFQQNQHIWKWWEGTSKHKNMLAINSSYWRCVNQVSLPPSHQLCLPQECNQVPAGLAHCGTGPVRPELCEEPWRFLGKNSKGRKGQPQEFAPVRRASVVWGCGDNKNSKVLVTHICLPMSSSRTGSEEAVHRGRSSWYLQFLYLCLCRVLQTKLPSPHSSNRLAPLSGHHIIWNFLSIL